MEAQLQQLDPQIELVAVYSKFVVAYQLQQDGPTPGWRKANIEGPVFIVRRHSAPVYQLIVKNNHDGTNLIDDLHPEWELDCQSKYIFYKVEDPTKKIRGLWFHDDSERLRVEEQLERLLRELRAAPPADFQPAPRADPAPPPQAAAPPTAPAAAPAGSVTVTAETVRAALHLLAEDDAFVKAVMDSLASAQSG
mmetsp:Transcript_77960/g.216195  ORF Transcript_77960/g.216195 Transcript_77960/m.216195 type:complete len:194 (+) Transcript_77960:160-741(+)